MGAVFVSPHIRPFQTEDAPTLAALTLAAIVMIGVRAYSMEQVMCWAAGHPGAARFIDSAAKGDLILVARAADGPPAAYALMERDGHLDMLYCHPDFAGQGFATALLAQIEVEARQAGIGRIFAEASEISRPVFERSGYTLLHRRDFALMMGGAEVAMHNYAMEKLLD